ncbi:MAG: hypothetical protein HPY90_09990 [Syntrophothermus sp.]|uniref:sodium:solute symporter family transporter n=1 Tax=Syntrophothermus sp. TaxID=2736299 RepID=UPI0025808BA2|nr:hypothetical protein [Syntrophothermus sp.]NSW83582.1 hypothetical protein [Syntrophothermus sp.]
MSAYIGLIIAFIYLIAMIAIGIVAMRWIKSGADFLVSGREVGWFVIASSLAACQVAGTTVAGYPGTAYNNGWGAVWGAWGWSISILIFGLLLARFIRRTGAVTLVEWFEASFGTETRVVVAIATIIALLFGGMAQFVGSANIVAGWLRMDYTTAVLIIGIATLIYMYTGGNWATVVTDAYQFIICAVALYVLLPAFLLV